MEEEAAEDIMADTEKEEEEIAEDEETEETGFKEKGEKRKSEGADEVGAKLRCIPCILASIPLPTPKLARESRPCNWPTPTPTLPDLAKESTYTGLIML